MRRRGYVLHSSVVTFGSCTHSWISSQAYDLAVIAVIFAIAGAAVLVYGAQLIRKATRVLSNAMLGEKLLAACNDDGVTAELVIANAQITSQLLDREIAAGFAHESNNYELTSDFRLRLARFNEDCE